MSPNRAHPRSWLSHRRSGSLHLGADVPSAPDGRRLGRPFFEVIPQLPPVFARAAFVWDNHAAQTSAVTAYNERLVSRPEGGALAGAQDNDHAYAHPIR